MDNETAKRMLFEGSAVILLNVPPTMQICLDAHSPIRRESVAASLIGFKMVPPGFHFLSWKNTTGAPSDQDKGFESCAGMCLFLSPKEFRVFELQPTTELEFVSKGCFTAEQLMEADRFLSVYALGSYKQYQTLTRHILKDDTDRLAGSRVVTSISSSVYSQRIERIELAKFNRLRLTEPPVSLNSEIELRFIEFDLKHSFTSGGGSRKEGGGGLLTHYHFDKSFLLASVIRQHSLRALLAEFELSFLLLLTLYNFEGFEHMRSIICLVCCSEELLRYHLHGTDDFHDDSVAQVKDKPLLHEFLPVLVAMLEVIDRDFVADIDEDLIAASLRTLFLTAQPLSSIRSPKLQSLVQKIAEICEKKFGWSLQSPQYESGEYAPQIDNECETVESVSEIVF